MTVAAVPPDVVCPPDARALALGTVTLAAHERNRARDEYAAAIVAARAAGATHRQIGRAAGVTEVAVRRLLSRRATRDD